jgi:hypothetical protein
MLHHHRQLQPGCVSADKRPSSRTRVADTCDEMACFRPLAFIQKHLCSNAGAVRLSIARRKAVRVRRK